jgi:hydroxymethylpyrimidine pyrophosphatase-like HAD family hydrolase
VATVLAPVCRWIDYVEEHEEHAPADNELERIKLIDKPVSHVYALVGLEDIEKVNVALGKIPGITFYWAPSTRGDLTCQGVQVNHIEADKFHGVAALRQLTGIAKENTLAIGDGTNDLSLFQNAGIKVAMGNASDELKAAADFVVADVANDGFVEAMERLVLSGEPVA